MTSGRGWSGSQHAFGPACAALRAPGSFPGAGRPEPAGVRAGRGPRRGGARGRRPAAPRPARSRATAAARTRARGPGGGGGAARARRAACSPCTIRSRSRGRSPQRAVRTRPNARSMRSSAVSSSRGGREVLPDDHAVAVAGPGGVRARLRDGDGLHRAGHRLDLQAGEVPERVRRGVEGGLAVAEVRSQGDHDVLGVRRGAPALDPHGDVLEGHRDRRGRLVHGDDDAVDEVVGEHDVRDPLRQRLDQVDGLAGDRRRRPPRRARRSGPSPRPGPWPPRRRGPGRARGRRRSPGRRAAPPRSTPWRPRARTPVSRIRSPLLMPLPACVGAPRAPPWSPATSCTRSAQTPRSASSAESTAVTPSRSSGSPGDELGQEPLPGDADEHAQAVDPQALEGGEQAPVLVRRTC